jgi:hypothetical protein
MSSPSDVSVDQSSIPTPSINGVHIAIIAATSILMLLLICCASYLYRRQQNRKTTQQMFQRPPTYSIGYPPGYSLADHLRARQMLSNPTEPQCPPGTWDPNSRRGSIYYEEWLQGVLEQEQGRTSRRPREGRTARVMRQLSGRIGLRRKASQSAQEPPPRYEQAFKDKMVPESVSPSNMSSAETVIQESAIPEEATGPMGVRLSVDISRHFGDVASLSDTSSSKDSRSVEDAKSTKAATTSAATTLLKEASLVPLPTTNDDL